MHNRNQSTTPSDKKPTRGIFWTITPVAIVFLLLMAAVQFIVLRAVPESAVQTGEQLSQNTRHILIDNYIISSEDQIEYFYSYGKKSVLEGGTILTENLLIHYDQSENQKISVIEMPFVEIASVEQIKNQKLRHARIYRINAIESGLWFNILLSTKKQGDEIFIQALKSKLTQSRLQTWI
ncbi:hypothetical protein KCN56_09255 [Photobacterium galatheae]|uniref:hypothetical protein n=1 Tax=Photobacterium galatheae TaxID=1654360 RepID=UPI00202CDDA0|nr:hypothetical protein [Photobacterium galatheae]MCM0148746.1 hypothetical protein [Photobacterium galatheae]